MTNLVLFFLILQIILLFFITFHDWVHIPPLTDIRKLEKHSSKKERFINSSIFFAIVFIPLLLTLIYRANFPLWILIVIFTFYGSLTMGTIFSWWIPYFFGSSIEHKRGFIEYQNTHRFLPPRGDNIVPNTFHVILHLQIWLCFTISLYLIIIYLLHS